MAFQCGGDPQRFWLGAGIAYTGDSVECVARFEGVAAWRARRTPCNVAGPVSPVSFVSEEGVASGVPPRGAGRGGKFPTLLYVNS